MSNKLLLVAGTAAVLSAPSAFAAGDADIKALRAEIAAMRQLYENKIDQLEGKIQALSSKQQQNSEKLVLAENKARNEIPATSTRNINDNSFNPEIGVILQGKLQNFSKGESEFSGFAIGEEGERGSEGLGLGETELNFSANVDDKFRGSVTVGIHEHGGATEVGVEEAFIETTSLPYGLQIKGGRFFSELGYLNSHHGHADDFADRPLTNRVFLDNNYGDDGIQLSAILPTDIYSEIGGGIYRGNDIPGGGASGSGIGAWTGYGRIGGDIGDNTSWRFGLSTLQTSNSSRSGNEDTVTFNGDNGLYIADARMVYAPTGNNAEQEIILQGEYFIRSEDGTYEDTGAGTGAVAYDDSQSGWYAQGVYKFAPQWRVGARYSQLNATAVPVGLVGSALDSGNHNPRAAAIMLDWTNSEFSRARAQFNREELSNGEYDNQFILQYTMSLGAHGAHAF